MRVDTVEMPAPLRTPELVEDRRPVVEGPAVAVV